MEEPEAKSDYVAAEVKPAAAAAAAAAAMMTVSDGKSTNSAAKPAHSFHQPHQPLHPPSPVFHHLGSLTKVSPGHQAEKIAALETELQTAHEELKEVKRQLAASETGKAQALREFTNIKNLLDQISLVEHFAASDDVEVESAPLPPNWRDGHSDLATEIDRLRHELEAAKNLNSKFAAELDRAKQEIDEVQHRSSSSEFRLETSRLQSELEAERDHQGSLTVELENAKKDIRTLQATLSDAWSHQGTCALDLARAKEEIAWLEADLVAAQSRTVELARAKDDIRILQEDLQSERRLQEVSANELLEAREEILQLRSQHAAASSGLASAKRALQADLEDLRGLHETTTSELEQEISALRADYEISVSESVDAKEKIRRLQGEMAAKGREFAIMLRATEEESKELQTKLEEVIGQYYSSRTELSEAMMQNEKLRAERDMVHVKYESCSSELFRVKEELFRQDVEHLASHEDLMTDIAIAQEENLKLQAEVTTLKDERADLSAELAEGKEDTYQLETRHYSACSELYNDIARLQSELTTLEGQHGKYSRELDHVKDVFEMELSQVQELHDAAVAELVHANDEFRRLQLDSTLEFERSLEVVRSLKQEICEVQSDLSVQYSALMVEKSSTEKKMEDVNSELLTTIARLQEAIAAQKKTETELAVVTTKDAAEAAAAANTLLADLEAAKAELVTAREAESKLQAVTLEVEELRAQMILSKQSVETAAVVPELRASLDTLHSELDAIKKTEAKFRETVTSSHAQIERLERHLYESRDSEAKAKESLVLTSSDLQQVSVELAIAKEALEWVGGDNAALSAELATKNAELEVKNAEVVSSTKEGEARGTAAFTDYSLKLQRMKSDLEDASKPVDKAFGLDLDEVNARLEKVTESERTMSESMASLKAELDSAKAKLVAAREDHGTALVEKEQQYEVELSQMRTQWEVAVMAEADEASFNIKLATKDAEKARQEVGELQAHIDTLEAKLETLQLDVETAKASEEWAFAQMRLKTIPECDLETEEGGVEAFVSWEEHQSLKMQAKELQDIVNKRVAVGVAEVKAAKASEREMQRRVDSVQKELRSCRDELSEAINKREEAEAAKFSCEAALRAKRQERKALAQSGGHLTGNEGHQSSSAKFLSPGDRQGSSLNGVSFEDSPSSSSPSRSSFSFASVASPGRSERSPRDSSTTAQGFSHHHHHQVSASEEKPRKLNFSSKIGAYFNKKKILV